MTALYELANEYRAAALTLSELDLDPQTIADTLEGLSGDLEQKATNVAMFCRNLEATAAQIKEAEQAMSARRKAIESRASHLRGYLLHSMQVTGLEKIACPYFALSIKKNPPAVVIEDEAQIPAAFMVQPEPPPAAPDKKAIANALKAGQDVPGARLSAGVRLEIK